MLVVNFMFLLGFFLWVYGFEYFENQINKELEKVYIFEKSYVFL